jgi:uncharacterized protein (TIGR03000 family)
MLRTTFAFGGTLLALAAVVFLAPGLSPAAGRGGFGGFHAGGYHLGGYHYGGYRQGGYHYGGYNYRPYYGGYGYGGYRYRPYYGGYYGSYPYYGYSPYTYSYSTDPYSYSDLSSRSVYDPGYSSVSYQPAPSSIDVAMSGVSTLASNQPSSASTSAAQADNIAHLTVNVPSGARLWVDNTPMTSKGTVRQFVSPPLTPGKRYNYDIKVSWKENGREVTQMQEVEVTPGGHVNVHFPLPTKTAGQASAVTRR